MEMDTLISEQEDIDWMKYDDESLNFLLSMEKNEFEVSEVIKNDPEDSDKIYFQDKHRDLLLDDNDISNFYIIVKILNVSFKLNATVHTNGLDLLKTMNNKLDKIYPTYCYEVKKKILKVHTLNDYIIDLQEPLGKFAYIRDCIKANRPPEYWVVDNPFSKENNISNKDTNFNNENTVFGFNKRNSNIDFQEEKSFIKCFNVNLDLSGNGGVANYKKLLSRNSLKTLDENNKIINLIENERNHNTICNFSNTKNNVNIFNDTEPKLRMIKTSCKEIEEKDNRNDNNSRSSKTKENKIDQIFNIGTHNPNKDKNINLDGKNSLKNSLNFSKSGKDKNLYNKDISLVNDPIREYLKNINDLMQKRNVERKNLKLLSLENNPQEDISNINNEVKIDSEDDDEENKIDELNKTRLRTKIKIQSKKI